MIRGVISEEEISKAAEPLARIWGRGEMFLDGFDLDEIDYRLDGLLEDARTQSRRDERAAILRFLRRGRDDMRREALRSPLSGTYLWLCKATADRYSALARAIKEEQHLGGPDLESNSGVAESSLRREGEEAGKATNT